MRQWDFLVRSDTRKQVDFHRSKRLWQPMLAKTLRDTFLEKFSDRLAKRLSPEEVKFLSKSRKSCDIG